MAASQEGRKIGALDFINYFLISEFQNKKNNIFEKQFNKQLKDFVLHTQWIPGRINGLNVDSYYDATIHYD